MHDNQIVELFFERNEKALDAAERKYGGYLTKISYNILNNKEDVKECVNDTYFAAWNSIPPQKPQCLSAYLAKICRRFSIDCFRKNHRKKRGGSEYVLSLDELQDCVSSGNAETQIDAAELSEAINKYLYSLNEEQRNIFVCRYFYLDSIKDTARYCGVSESNAKTILYRTRIGLREYLIKEDFNI